MKSDRSFDAVDILMTLRVILGVLVGGALGFGYYKFIGCSTGACPLTSNPWTATIYGLVVGALIAASLK